MTRKREWLLCAFSAAHKRPQADRERTGSSGRRFFTTVGLSAKLSSLKAGGRPLAILCAVTVLLLIVQNIVGILIASLAGAHPMYGLLVGSISFVGGPPASRVGPETTRPTPVAPIATVMQVLLLIVVAVLVGDAVNEWAREAGFVLPGFLTAMLAGTAMANLSDAFGMKIDSVPVERGGQIALHAFLVMYLMSLRLWTLGAGIGPLVANVVIHARAPVPWVGESIKSRFLLRRLVDFHDGSLETGS